MLHLHMGPSERPLQMGCASPVFVVSLSVSSSNGEISALLLDCPNPPVLNNGCSLEHFPYVNTHTGICIVQFNDLTVLMPSSALFCNHN